ncbi:septum site-determining protein MinC [Clostridium botulinum]|nr:septum site-determining protein MinC [Clostridium botulinum]MBY6794771.1 septum site-determining protein MinC [Clostridium botulinum]MBY6866293.1 septum site-determining protein MinC [Clostridium botulinum]
MLEDNIVIKGNKEGLVVIINMNKFRDFNDMINSLIQKLSHGKQFYKGSTLKISTELKLINEKNLRRLKDVLFEEFMIKDCIFEDKEDRSNKPFSGIYEGRTKFIRRTVRGGQVVRYNGNLVIIGDVNSGAEIYTAGNVIVLGALRGHVHAGFTGNHKAIVAAFYLQPSILQIANVMTRSPEDNVKPQYPEVAKIKSSIIVVEPYLPDKFI